MFKWALPVRLCLLAGLIFCTDSSVYASPYQPLNSKNEIEITVAGVLKEAMGIQSSLEAREDDVKDLLIRAKFQDIPGVDFGVALLINAKLIAVDANGEAVSQALIMSAVGDADISKSDKLEVLEALNNFNSQEFPVKLFSSGRYVVATTSTVFTRSEPLTDEKIITSVVSVLDVWKLISEDVKRLASD